MQGLAGEYFETVVDEFLVFGVKGSFQNPVSAVPVIVE